MYIFVYTFLMISDCGRGVMGGGGILLINNKNIFKENANIKKED